MSAVSTLIANKVNAQTREVLWPGHSLGFLSYNLSGSTEGWVFAARGTAQVGEVVHLPRTVELDDRVDGHRPVDGARAHAREADAGDHDEKDRAGLYGYSPV